MRGASEARSFRQVLETLIEQRKVVSETEAKDPNHPMYDSAEAGILSLVPDRQLVVEGQVLKPEPDYETETPLPGWQPGKERGMSVKEFLRTFEIDGLSLPARIEATEGLRSCWWTDGER